MPKWTEAKISERIRKGYGRGEGLDYKSWYKKTELKNSESNLNQIKGHLIRRPYQLTDALDCLALRKLERVQNVVDVWENYRLNREVTLAITEQLGVDHPCYMDTEIPEVLTVRLLAVIQDDFGEPLRFLGINPAWSSKMSKKWLLRQDICSLYLEHELKAQPLKSFTENETSEEVLKSFNWVTRAYEISATDFPGINLKKIQERLIKEVSSGAITPINQACNQIDSDLKYPCGSSLRICRSMLAHGILNSINLDMPVGESSLLSTLTADSNNDLLS